MQVVVRKIQGDELIHEVFDCVTSICQLEDFDVSVSFKSEDGKTTTRYICLDGYTDLIVR